MTDPAFTPFSVGVYRCTQRLSAGRSGELFAAYHRKTRDLRAIRRISPEVLGDKALADVVLQNLSRLHQMSHPNVLRLLELIEEDGQMFAVMDYVQGANLMRLLARVRETNPLPPPVATFIASQICQALDHANHFREEGRPAPLVHGALWPPNVLVSSRGEVRVSDFGSWVIPTGMHGEEGNVSIRTQFSYRSPEHVNGSTLTSASDIFCVGILLHELLTGRQLFLGKSLMETLELVENATVESFDGIPDLLVPVVRRCLEREPAARYTDPASLVSELSVAMPRSGAREVRQELATMIEALPRPASAPPPLAPEPLLAGSGDEPADEQREEGATKRSNLPPVPPPNDLTPEPVAPLTPLPGLREDIDEPTNINPTGVTEALVALSKDTTDPGALDFFGSEEPEEPTRIDPIIPGITGPEPLPALGGDDADRPEGPTDVAAPVDQRVLWDSPDDDTVPKEEETDTDAPPVGMAQKPHGFATTAEDDDEESTVKTPLSGSQSGIFAADDEPTIQAPHKPLDSLSPPPSAPGPVSAADSDDEPTLPVPPDAAAPVFAAGAGPFEESEDEPTLQGAAKATGKPGVPAGTLPWPALEKAYPDVRRPQAQPLGAAPPPAQPLRQRGEGGTPGVEALAQTALASGGAAPDANAAAARPGELEFSYSTGDEIARPQPRGGLPNREESQPEMVSEVSTFDRDRRHDSVSEVSIDHFDQDSLVSGVSHFDGDSSVFSVSMERPRSRFTAAHILLLVAIIVFLVAVGLLIRRLVLQSQSKRQQSLVQPIADAGQVTPRSTALEPDAPAPKKPVRPPPKRGGQGTPVHSSGQHLDALLHGKLEAGMLRVKTKPAGMLYVNGKRVGETPVTAKVRAGDRIKLAVAAPRFELHRQTVDVPLSRGLSLEVTLREASYPRAEGRRRGWLAVHCKRKDRRRILINGQDTGYSCPGPVIFRLRPGRYRVGFYSLVTGKTKGRRVRVRQRHKTHIWAPRR